MLLGKIIDYIKLSEMMMRVDKENNDDESVCDGCEEDWMKANKERNIDKISKLKGKCSNCNVGPHQQID